jgi:hypothetical protein
MECRQFAEQIFASPWSPLQFYSTRGQKGSIAADRYSSRLYMDGAIVERVWTEDKGYAQEAFLNLLNWLKGHTDLDDSNLVSAEEKLFMFLYIVAHGTKFRVIAELFQHSMDTVHKYILLTPSNTKRAV